MKIKRITRPIKKGIKKVKKINTKAVRFGRKINNNLSSYIDADFKHYSKLRTRLG